MKKLTPIQFAYPKDFPGEYGADVPVGEFEARLDFRVATDNSCSQCFFTHLGTGEKFTIPAFRPGFFSMDFPESGTNFVNDSIPVQNAFKLITERNCFGRAVWKSAVSIPECVASEKV